MRSIKKVLCQKISRTSNKIELQSKSRFSSNLFRIDDPENGFKLPKRMGLDIY